jgi:membrane protease YdiL (CAAX protease family)
MAQTIMLCIGYLLLASVLVGSVYLIDTNKQPRLIPLATLSGVATLLFMFSQYIQIATGLAVFILLILSAALPSIFSRLSHHKSFLSKAIKVVLILSTVFICFALAAHVIPGFNNMVLHENVIISPAAGAINIKANIDKALAGIILLFLMLALALQPRHSALRPKSQLTLIPLYVLLVLVVAYFSGLNIDIKLPAQFISFALTNLLFSVIAEEALFRGLIQNGMSNLLKEKTQYAAYIGIIFTSVIFGLVHLGGGWHFVVLATFAGLLYGWVYHKSGKLSLAILTHWGVNIGHFLLLVYPVPK